jgi:hypothetical protein
MSTMSNVGRRTELHMSAAGTLPAQESTLEVPEPGHYWSDRLQAAFWVCATAAHATAFHTEGQVAYLPDEIWLLQELKARDPASFPAKLRAIHQAKHVFGGVIASLEQATDPVGIPVFQTRPDACYACGTTRRWQSSYGAVVCARCHPPAAQLLVTAWEGKDDVNEGEMV